MAINNTWVQKEEEKRKEYEQKAIRAGEDRVPIWNKYLQASREGRHAEAAQYKQQADQLENQMVQYQNMLKGIDPRTGEPMRPEYQSLIDPTSGLLQKQYILDIGQLEAGQMDPTKMEGYQAFRSEALRTGPSTWAKMMQQQQELARMTEMEKAARQSGSSAAQARSGLAMKGGLSSGSAERIARDQASNLLQARQGIGRAANMANIQLLTEDERNRLANLSQLPGMESSIEQFNIGQKTNQDRFNIEAQARAKQYNIGEALRDKQLKDAQDLAAYEAQLGKYGAERQAQATERSSTGGGK